MQWLSPSDLYYPSALFYLLDVDILQLAAGAAMALIRLGGYDYGLRDYWRPGLFGNILMLAFVLAWIALAFFVGPAIPEALKKKLLFWSKAVTPFYIIQWILLGWIMVLSGMDRFGHAATILLMIAATIGSDRLTSLYLRLRRKRGPAPGTPAPANGA